MMVVDEVKTDSSECEMYDERHDSVHDSTFGSELDKPSNNDVNCKFHFNNTVSEDNVVSGLHRKGIETASLIPCTEGSYDNDPDKDLDKDLDYALSSPPTPLMDEPQDNVSFMNRDDVEQQTTEDVVAKITSELGHSDIQDACANKGVSVKSPPISTFNDSLSFPIISITAAVEKDDTQNSRQAESDEMSAVFSDEIKNMQSDDICNKSDRLSDFSEQNHLPVSDTLTLPDQTSDLQTTVVVSTATVSSDVSAGESVKTESATCTTTSICTQPIKTLLSGQNQMPDITSRLESVYKSLLETNFESSDGDKSSGEANGLIPHKKLHAAAESIPESDLSDFVVTKSPNCLTSVVKPECVESGVECNVNEKSVSEPLQITASVESEVEKVLGDAISSVSYCTVQDTSVKMSPHKLKLHATTKTPLPAKKSYIQQVHPQVKLQEEQTQQTSFNEIVKVLPTVSDQRDTSELVCDNESERSNQVEGVSNFIETCSH